MLEEIEKVLEFIVELDELKQVLRKTRPIGLDRLIAYPQFFITCTAMPMLGKRTTFRLKRCFK